MDQTTKPVDIARAFRIIHSALVTGVVLVGVSFVFLVRVQGRSVGATPTLGIGLAAVCIGLLALAAFVLRARVPDRSPQDSPETYWASVPSRSAAIMLWAVTEGAALVGWVGYLITNVTLPAAAAVLATVMLIWYRPSHLEGAA